MFLYPCYFSISRLFLVYLNKLLFLNFMKTYKKDNSMRGDKKTSGRSFDGSRRGEKTNGRGFGGKREDRPVSRSFGTKKEEGATKYKTICSECGNNCEVPFKPNGKKPILCSFCFAKSGDDGNKTERFSGRAGDNQLDIMNEKLDKILKMLTRLSK